LSEELDNIEQNGVSLISDIAQIYDNYGFATEILVASVRHPMHLVKSALMGVRVETIPFKVIRQLVQHPLTDKGLDFFVSD
jgi:transaldolase